jgi:hypothetical protein
MDDFADKIESITKTLNSVSFLCADDIVIISKTEKGLIKALKSVEEHIRKNNYMFNTEKCANISKRLFKYKINKKEISP